MHERECVKEVRREREMLGGLGDPRRTKYPVLFCMYADLFPCTRRMYSVLTNPLSSPQFFTRQKTW